MTTNNPILDDLVEYTREETALDVELREEGGRYFVRVGGMCAGPMDHGQAWFYLLGIQVSRQATPTLDTKKMRSRKARDEGLVQARRRHEEDRVAAEADRLAAKADAQRKDQ